MYESEEVRILFKILNFKNNSDKLQKKRSHVTWFLFSYDINEFFIPFVK